MPPNVNPAAMFAGLFVMILILAAIASWITLILRLALGLPVLPPWMPRRVPWGGGSVLITMLLAFMVIPTIVAIGFQLPMMRPKAGAELNPGRIMTFSATQNAVTLIVVPLVLAAVSGARPRDFGLVRRGFFRRVGEGVVAYPGLVPIVFGVSLISVLIWGKTPHPLETAIAEDKTPGMAAILVLAGVVLAPLAEELIFRGIILGWLTKAVLQGKPPAKPDPFDDFEPSTLGQDYTEPSPVFDVPMVDSGVYDPFEAPSTQVATLPEIETTPDIPFRLMPLLFSNIAVSLVFAALHAPVWPTPIPIFFLSLVLGMLYQRTGSIVGPITVHVIFNGVSTLMMFLAIGAVEKKDPKAPDPIPTPACAPSSFPGNFSDFNQSIDDFAGRWYILGPSSNG